MIKRGEKRIVFFGTFTQIFLIVSMSFALSFLLSDNFVSGGPLTNLLAPGNPGTAAAKAPAGISAGQGSINDLTKAGFSGVTKIEAVSSNPNIVNAYGDNGNLIATYDKTTGLASSASQPYPAKLLGFGPPITGGWGHLVAGLNYAILVAGAIQLIGSIAGLDPALTKSLTYSAVGGIMAGKLVGSLGPTGFNAIGAGSKLSWLTGGYGQFAAGLVVAAVIFIATYSKESKKTVNFQCMPFEPLLGGSKCEQCNADPFRPCSEYRCKSLGQACELLNKGTTSEQCTWVSRNDVKSPTITPWNEALYPSGLKYAPDTAVRPPAIGTKVLPSSGSCLPAFTPLEFGLLTDEPAQCKIDYNHTAKFDLMQYYVGDTNYYSYNHTQKLRLPGPTTGNTTGLPELKNDGNFGLYVRCRDANGNENVDEYVFSFCVDKGPDTTPPVIEGFSLPSGSYIGFNTDTTPIELYVNEPSTCKWSTQSKTYEDMENSMACATSGEQVNANLQYVCSGNVTGINSQEENKFYFRCKDQPTKADNERNVNVQSKELVLKGSQPLNIISFAPNETIAGSTDVVSVDLQLETDDGAENGKAICYFSPTGAKDSFISMFETNNFVHKQTLSLSNGDYSYYFRCIDAGGNAAEVNTSFNVFVDKQPPKVTRVYKQDALKIVTDEDAECSYSTTNCNFNFEDGLKMIYSTTDIKNNLYAEWKSGMNYYIKCRDLYGNDPDPNSCSISVNAIEFKGKIN